jgi:glycosyltransferase involved in cell wall biosynthesis
LTHRSVAGSEAQHGWVTLEHEVPGADVLFVTNIWPYEARPEYGIFVYRQIQSLIAAGVKCDVLFIRGYRSPLAYAVAALRLLWWSMVGRKYRVVHSHGGESAPAARFYVRAPLVASYLGDDLNGTPDANGRVHLPHRVRAAVLRQLSRLTTATITKSAEMQTRLPRRVADRNLVLPNGVDRELFAPIDRDEARTRLGWEADQPVVLFPSNPGPPRKRLWLARVACEQAALTEPRLRLHVAYPARPEEMPLLMNASDCMLLTSSSEGSPNAVKEALAVDLPVVATAVGDVPELLSGVNPSVVCAPEPQALADAVLTCLGARSNGRRRSEHLDERVIAQRLIDLYRRLGWHGNADRTESVDEHREPGVAVG